MSDQSQAATAPHPVIRRLQEAINAHDLDAMVACFASDVVSQQPVHPARSFQGNEQIRQNWTMILGGVPDLRAELLRSAQSGDTVWSEWHWSGTRVDGAAHEMRGVTVNQVKDDRIASVTFYMEPVEAGGADVETAIKAIMGAQR
ncbi:MAG TPA: nuclear transport factor 2 family protein [Candidatus Dormibacteraeota bacterium]|nr:nuclear transport factor 2 family protein [Candidatus Dormibacteraeota bacterium]